MIARNCNSVWHVCLNPNVDINECLKSNIISLEDRRSKTKIYHTMTLFSPPRDHKVRDCSPPPPHSPPNQNFKKQDFVNRIFSNVLLALPFSRNQLLK